MHIQEHLWSIRVTPLTEAGLEFYRVQRRVYVLVWLRLKISSPLTVGKASMEKIGDFSGFHTSCQESFVPFPPGNCQNNSFKRCFCNFCSFSRFRRSGSSKEKKEVGVEKERKITEVRQGLKQEKPVSVLNLLP